MREDDHSAARPETATEARAILRLTADFILRWAETWIVVFSDLEYLIIYTALLQANVRRVTRDPAQNLRYGYGEAPPDSLREPITVRALSDMLGMPRETVRRRIAVLEGVEAVQRVDHRGFIVPRARVEAGDFVEAYQTYHRNIKQLYRGFRAAGLTPATVIAPDNGGEKFRLTMRLAGDFILDWVLLAGRPFAGEAMLALVFSAILQTSLRGLDDDATIEDAALRPIPVHALAVSMNLAPESVRRYVRRLEAMGYVARVGGEGVVTPTRVFDDPAALALAEALKARVLTLFGDLAGYGVALADDR